LPISSTLCLSQALRRSGGKYRPMSDGFKPTLLSQPVEPIVIVDMTCVP
jgi:hypothetical protein